MRRRRKNEWVIEWARSLRNCIQNILSIAFWFWMKFLLVRSSVQYTNTHANTHFSMCMSIAYLYRLFLRMFSSSSSLFKTFGSVSLMLLIVCCFFVCIHHHHHHHHHPFLWSSVVVNGKWNIRVFILAFVVLSFDSIWIVLFLSHFSLAIVWSSFLFGVRLFVKCDGLVCNNFEKSCNNSSELNKKQTNKI